MEDLHWWVIDEWIDGTGLDDLLRSGKPDGCLSRQWIKEIAESLLALHEKEVLRRELSPKTVLIDDESRSAILTEFELAKLLDGSPTVSKEEWPIDPYRAPEAASEKFGELSLIHI